MGEMADADFDNGLLHMVEEDMFEEMCLNHFLRTQFRRKQTPQEAFRGLGENNESQKRIRSLWTVSEDYQI